MFITRKLYLGAIAAGIFATGLYATPEHNIPGHEFEAELAARQGLMQLYAFNISQLGAMAKGAIDYDSAAADIAANNLAALSRMGSAAMWPAGSDILSIETGAALPGLWENFPDVGAKAMALTEAADAMVAAASTDLAALQAAMRPLGGACSACHKAYRQSEE